MDTIVDVPQKYKKPMIASTFMWNDHATDAFVKKGIPLFPAPEDAVNAMAALVRYGEIKCDLERNTAGGNSKDYSQSKKLRGGIMNEYKSKRLLCKYGIETSQERMVESLDDALELAAEIGWPVVLKGLPEGVAHKSEAGLVHLNIASAQNLKAAWSKIESNHAGCPKMLARMLDGGRELLMGMTRYNGFGPVIMLGAGGIFTEAIKDVTMRAAPLSYADAYSMLDSLKLKKLFGNIRGMAELDRDLLAKALVSLSDMVMEHPEIDEVDVNPLLVVDGRPVAVDGLVVSS